MLKAFLAFAAVTAGARVQRRQSEDCSTTRTLDPLTVTRVEPISIYILSGQLAPTGTDDERFTAVYTTVYPTFCPECSQGLRPATYTVTQTCTGSITSCTGYGDDLPPGFTTTQATCSDCPTPFTAVLTVPQPTDVVITSTYIEVITAPDLTTTRTFTKTCAGGPCLPEFTATGTGRVSTIDAGLYAEPVTQILTATATVTQTDESTVTVTAEPDPSFRPNSFNSNDGGMLSSDKSLALGMSVFALSFVLMA
ncbi:hypothetical protein CCHL11_06674 [Colletotrichum chlorophyti]|uniref:Uncharacterized protein n=1 Tax=Colletotrichum chlorophyti TaxID=708187 RepID=A0A1Q8RXQ6_9PEZI|nr:hypothetical protein CCHL11_06674 [Colletotrichum chlorophyti]